MITKRCFGKELKLILDVQTTNVGEVRMCVIKTLTDLSKTTLVNDEECILYKSLFKILEPVKLMSNSLCRNEVNLITCNVQACIKQTKMLLINVVINVID